MPNTKRLVLRLSSIILVIGASSVAAGRANVPERPTTSGQRAVPTFTVDGRVALHSFMSLSDGHLKKLADLLHLLATTDDARSGEWERIRGQLAGVAPMTVPAVLWFAEPDGTYWTVTEGRAAGKLSDRAYFPRVLGGETVIGDLVVSHSTNRNTAIVAVPVRDRGNTVVGVLGSSVHLDSLGKLVQEEMGVGGDLLFFAIDSTPRGALHSDPTMIFTEPMQLGDEGMRKAFTEILSSPEGTVTYTFRGSPRTMLYRKSPVTGWWYAVGVLRK